ncbi:uncharacterized protein AMSG_10959 [Thecamonas trahens ATCC 50062]|uniref:Uncharacterized protein n=1 Tax=Thecamonas trahens ATCC 50062 TaxID=461836 RepID=A0A0L0DSJ2_THETB|nr:hypothetical protein AMSG_10959 [Thecamonas trahens ATCC 50062]KNC55314.1 hypothetical protein AMSG_10959 [Thecamonas trahens ATCC 50062]|eukprot:XP_013753037.1 hypothetical protein AMSG_10959 [Thecamonas trahens ATCC 50062]
MDFSAQPSASNIYREVSASLPSSDFTIEFWYRTGDVDTYQNFISVCNGGDSGSHPLNIGVDRNNVCDFMFATSLHKANGLCPVDEEWHHMAAVITASPPLGSLWIDGKLAMGPYEAVETLATSGLTIALGNDLDGSSCSPTDANQASAGFMAELRFWSYAMNAGDIARVMAGPVSPTAPNLVRYYNFGAADDFVNPLQMAAGMASPPPMSPYSSRPIYSPISPYQPRIPVPDLTPPVLARTMVAATTPDNIRSCTVVDLNGDGLSDIVASQATEMSVPGQNSLFFVLSHDNGTTSAPIFVSDGVRLAAVAAKDVSGNGVPDIFVYNEASSRVDVYLGTMAAGKPSYAAAPYTSAIAVSTTTLVLVPDLDGDGLADALYVSGTSLGWISFAPSPPTSTTLFGASDISLGLAGEVKDTPIMADVNSDGLADLLYIREVGGWERLYAAVRTTWPAVAFDTGSPVVLTTNTRRIYLADLNGDGLPEILTSKTQAWDVWQINGDVSVSYISTINPSIAGTASHLVFTDVDYDGFVDVVLGFNHVTSAVIVSLQRGNMTFARGASYGIDSVSGAACIGAGVFEPSSPRQLISGASMAGGALASGDMALWYTGPIALLDDALSAISLASDSSTWCASGEVPDVVASDLNHDTAIDLLVVCKSNATTIALYGDGSSGFLSPRVRTPPPSMAALADVALADINSDGMLDVIAISADGLLAVSLFVSVSTTPLPADLVTVSTTAAVGTPTSLVTVDANGDGDVDVVVGGSAGLAILLNAGIDSSASSPLAGPGVLLAVGVPGVTMLTTADLSGSGSASDLVWLSSGSQSVYLATINESATSPSAVYASHGEVALGSDPTTICVGELNSNTISDVVVAMANGTILALVDGNGSNMLVLGTDLAGPIHRVAIVPMAVGFGHVVATRSTDNVWLGALAPHRPDYRTFHSSANGVVADINSDGIDDVVAMTASGGRVHRGSRSLGFRARSFPRTLPECGGVAGSIVCLSARAARAPAGYHLELDDVPQSGSRCVRASGEAGYHTLRRDVVIGPGTIDCGGYGGVLYSVSSSATVTLDHVVMTSRASDAPVLRHSEAGAAMVVEPSATLIMTNVSMTGFVARAGTEVRSSAAVLGGALRIRGSLIARNVSFTHCAASQFGGAVAVQATGAADLVDAVFESNSVLDGPKTAVAGGGALGVAAASSFSCTRCAFYNNVANGEGNGGGAVALRAMVISVTMADSVFVGNSAAHGYGGAVLVEYDGSGTTTTLARCRLEASYARMGGSVAAAVTSVLAIGAGSAVPPSSSISILSSSSRLALPDTVIVSSGARYGGVALSCGAVVDLSASDLAATTISYEQAGGVWFQCPPLGLAAVIVGGSVADAMTSNRQAYGPARASAAVSMTWSGSGSVLRQASGIALGASGGVLVASDVFGQTVTDDLVTISLRSASSMAEVSPDQAEWDGSSGGYSLKRIGVEISGGFWPAELDKAHDVVAELPNGEAVLVPVVVNGCPVGFGATSAVRSEALVCVPCTGATESTEISVEPCTIVPSCTGTGWPIDGVCVDCPANTIRLARGNATAGAVPPCVCAAGFWNAESAADLACEACPTGASCAGGSGPSAAPYARKGYYRVREGEFAECLIKEACIGRSQCAPQYATGSLLCKDCASGAYRQPDGGCLSCPQAAASLLGVMAVGVVLAAVVACVLAVMAVKEFQKREESESVQSSRVPHTLSLAVIFFQILGMLAKAPFNWPQPPVQQILEAANVANVDISVFAVDCSVPAFAVRYAMSMYTTWLSCGCFAAIDRQRMSIVDIIRWALFSFGPLVYIPLSRSTLDYFDCTQYPDGKWYLDSEPSEECFTGRWALGLPLALIGLVLYVIAMPMVFAAVLYKWRAELGRAHIVLRYGALYSVFRKHYYFAGVVFMIKRLTIVIFSVFASNVHMILFTGLLAVFVTSMLMVSKHAPYLYQPLNDIELKLDLCIIALLVAGLLFWVDEFPNQTVYVIFVVAVVVVIGFALATLIIGCLFEAQHLRNRARVVSGSQGMGFGRDELLFKVVRKHAPDLSPHLRSALNKLDAATVASDSVAQSVLCHDSPWAVELLERPNSAPGSEDETSGSG